MKCCKCEYAEQFKIVGRAFTEYECSECAQVKSHPNTLKPKLCRECSHGLGKCESCGDFINYNLFGDV